MFVTVPPGPLAVAERIPAEASPADRTPRTQPPNLLPDDLQVAVGGIGCHGRKVFIGGAHLILQELPRLRCLISVQVLVKIISIPQDSPLKALDQQTPIVQIAR